MVIKTRDSGKKIKIIGNEMKKVDMAKISAGLGAVHQSPLTCLTKEQAQQYEPIGGPYLMAIADEFMILRNCSSMLQSLGRSLDEVAGYRILDVDEETEFRQRCTEERSDPYYLHLPVVRYYGKKLEQK